MLDVPKLIPAFVSTIGNEPYHCVLGSRILGGHACNGGPIYIYPAIGLFIMASWAGNNNLPGKQPLWPAKWES